MKKLISIGVVVALLALVVLPGVVGADTIMPSTYAKIPFGILSTGISLLGDIVTALPASITGGTDLSWIPTILNPVADWVGGPLAWLTELTAWTMVTVGDVVAALPPCRDLGYCDAHL